MARRAWVKLWTSKTLYGTTFRELLPDERAVWFGLLCLAGDSVTPGVVCVAPGVPYTQEQLAQILNVPLALLKRAIAKMLSPEVNKIEKDQFACLIVKGWTEYQPDWDRIKQYPSQQAPSRKPTTNSVVGNLQPQVEEEVEEEIEEERKETTATTARARDPALAEMVSVYEANIAPITPMARERLLEIERTYAAEWFPAAVGEAIGAGVRKLNYVEAILARWKTDGFKADRQKRNNGSKPEGAMSKMVKQACEECGSVVGRGWRTGCGTCIGFLRESRGDEFVETLMKPAGDQ